MQLAVWGKRLVRAVPDYLLSPYCRFVPLHWVMARDLVEAMKLVGISVNRYPRFSSWLPLRYLAKRHAPSTD